MVQSSFPLLLRSGVGHKPRRLSPPSPFFPFSLKGVRVEINAILETNFVLLSLRFHLERGGGGGGLVKSSKAFSRHLRLMVFPRKLRGKEEEEAGRAGCDTIKTTLRAIVCVCVCVCSTLRKADKATWSSKKGAGKRDPGWVLAW